MFGRHVRHGGEKLRVALVPDQPGDGGHDHPPFRHAQRLPDPGTRFGIWLEAAGVAAIAHGDRIAMDFQAPRVLGFLLADGQEHVGEQSARALHGERGGASRPWPGLIEQEPVARIGHPRHAGGACGGARQKAADRHMGVHEVGLFAPEQGVEFREGACLCRRRQAARQGYRRDTQTFRAHIVKQRSVCADA